jgi:hypothetical protein
MDIDTKLRDKVKQKVEGTLQTLTLDDVFKALLPEGYSLGEVAHAVQALMADGQMELDGVELKIPGSSRRPS